MALVVEMTEQARKFLDFFYLEEESSAVEPEKAKLARVPKVLRDDESIKQCFEPKFVSIGPYHHGKPKLQEAEKLKKKLAKQFVLACTCSAETLYRKLYNEINQIRDFYEKGGQSYFSIHDDDDFTQILFVDGCFLLYFIHCLLERKLENFIFMKHHIRSVQMDVCLLENQLPFQVLKLLGDENFKNWPGLIKWYIEFIGNTFIPTKGRWENYNLQPENSSHLVQLLQIGLQGSCKVERDFKYQGSSTLPSSYSVTELREVGIHCKPSSRRGFKCTSFNPHLFRGVLELPSMAVDFFTRTNLLNLIAYEMHPDVHDLEIQSYIFFLASLLRQPQDVKALRKARVLNNYLGSDEEVVELFKEIAAKSSPEKVRGHHREIQMQIGSYLDKRGRTKIATWLAEVFSVYFRSPWTTVTVLAGFLALSATIIQTVLKIISYKKKGCESICKYIHEHICCMNLEFERCMC